MIGVRRIRRATAALGMVLVVAAPLILACSPVAAAAVRDFTTIDAHVRATMEASAVPGAAYAVVEDGRVVHLAAFGVAGPDGRPMTPQTPLVIGSVGKSITALAIRQLVEAGLIELDAPVTRYLPWFSLAGPNGATAGVTIGSLLAHTSGLSTASGQDPRLYAPGLTAEGVVRGLAAVRADRTAGTYEYSNLNYVVLGVVVEAVSGQAYGDYVRDHIFRPLGMTRSFTSLADAAAAGPAQGHRYLFGVPVPLDEPYPSAIVAAGYQVSSAEDMAHFAAALANGGLYEGVDVVTPGGPATTDRSLGTDWQPLTQARAISSQSGETLNTNADLLTAPGQRLGVVVLFNANPIQFLGLPAGAAELALDVMRLSSGGSPTTSAPTVRTVYLVLDVVLVALLIPLLIHALRARTWRRRLAGSGHRTFLIVRTVVADLVLPIGALVGIPLLIGSSGSSSAGDIAAGWGFALWTLPDLALSLLGLALGALAIGAVKLIAVGAPWFGRRARPWSERLAPRPAA